MNRTTRCYELVCLPLWIYNGDGALVRAIIRKMKEEKHGYE